MLEFIESAGWKENTVVVITSDHGELFGEHKMFTHMLACYEPELSVPLIIRYPASGARGIRISNAVEAVDVAPTILALCGLNVPTEYAGRALLTSNGGVNRTNRPFTLHRHWSIATDERIRLGFPEEALYNATVLRTAGKKLYLFDDPDRTPLLFDVSDYPKRTALHDPQALRTLTEAGRALLSRQPGPATTQPMDPELLDALRALGYVE